MRRVRAKATEHQSASAPPPQLSVPLDDGTVTLALIQALIPLRLRAVEEALQEEVRALAGARYAHHDPRDTGLFRRVLAGLSCREYEAAAEAVPEAFGLAKSSVSRPFIRNSARAVQQHEPLGVVMPPLPFRDPVTLDAMCPSE